VLPQVKSRLRCGAVDGSAPAFPLFYPDLGLEATVERNLVFLPGGYILSDVKALFLYLKIVSL